MFPAALLVPVAYLVGTFPTAVLVGRRTGHDPSTEGSANPGASNTYRVAGRRAGIAVLVGDMVKGALPTAVGLAVGGRPLGLACGAAAVVGHIVPVTRRLRGGKGVATASGMALVLYPWLSVALTVLFVAVALVWRRASLASLTLAVALPVGVAITGHPWWETLVITGLALAVIARHHENIGRLVRGEEPAFGTRPTP